MYITEKCEYVFVQNQQKKVVLRVCGKKKKKNLNKKKLLASVMFLFYVFYFFIFLMMYVCIWLSVSVYVCVWLILYIWCSLRWKSGRCPGLILFFFLLFRPCTVPVGVSDNYAREWFSDCWMWFYWERSSVDWLFVRVNLKKKKKKAILFNFLCCQKFKQIWESGALVLWRSIAWLL